MTEVRAGTVGVIAAAVLGLIPLEYLALGLAALALVVASLALALSTKVYRAVQPEVERQAETVEDLTSQAAVVESKIRDDRGG